MSGRLIDEGLLKDWAAKNNHTLGTGDHWIQKYHLEKVIDSGALDAQSPTPGQDGLMPCPLPNCGSEAEYYALHVANYFEHTISCKECGLRLAICNTSKEMPPKSMFTLWNTRAPSTTQPEKENET